MISRRTLLKTVLGSVAASSPLASARADWVGEFDTGSAAMGTHFSSDPLLSEATLSFTRSAEERYRGIAAGGGWSQTPWVGGFRLGSRHPQVEAVRQRLIMEGDLDPQYTWGTTFDSFVDSGVRRFQVRHGLTVDGVAGSSTLDTMNEPASAKAEQLSVSAERIAQKIAAENRYVCVNIPSAELELVENEQVVERHPTIVGKADRKTPILTSAIYEVNFNPYWTVPASIIRKDLIPTIRADFSYLERMSMRIFDRSWNEVEPTTIDWSGDEATNYYFRQDPGSENALGRVRINFANDHAVYLHDTPNPMLFGDAARFHSSGCIRVQRIPEFVTWLLKETPGWSLAEVQEMLRNGERRDVTIARKIPVHFVYVTAWSSPDLTTSFRDDIYSVHQS